VAVDASGENRGNFVKGTTDDLRLALLFHGGLH
jgi:hypothetical protein